MSSISRWSYTSKATVWPLLGRNQSAGGSTYGEPYQIACTWIGKAEARINNDGKEFISRVQFFHEDARVKYMDKIAKGEHVGEWMEAKGEDIKSHIDYPMTMFGKKEIPDFESTT